MTTDMNMYETDVYRETDTYKKIYRRNDRQQTDRQNKQQSVYKEASTTTETNTYKTLTDKINRHEYRHTNRQTAEQADY